ncbi:hypothetical protein FB446DRAFT_721893 [Lentinula raphanica]|nr:hypothetical protein FB446DRAFT_721893 [Lentinula raphanica]
MRLMDLPDDILLNVLNFLDLPQILLLRKICKRSRALTFEHAVWVNAYRHSGYFLPSGNTDNRTVEDLERALVHAHRLQTVWGDLSSLRKRPPQPVAFIKPNIRFLKLHRGRYVVMGTTTSLSLYDLHAEKELFQHQITTKPLWLHFQHDTTLGKDGLFIPFARHLRNSSATPHFQLCICKLDSLDNPIFEDIAGARIYHDCIAGAGQEFFVASQKSGGTLLLHVPSQRVYMIDAGTSLPNRLTNVIFIPGHVLLIFIDYVNMMEGKLFELYPLPDSASMGPDLRMVPTHRGLLSMHFSEASLFSTGVSVAGDAYIWLVVLAGLQLWALRITLQPDGNMAFHKPVYDIYRFDEHIMARAFDLRFTTNGTQGRGISRFANPKLSWLKYDVRGGPDGDVSIVRTIIDSDVLPPFTLYDFDGFEGLLCGLSGADDNEITNLIM